MNLYLSLKNSLVLANYSGSLIIFGTLQHSQSYSKQRLISSASSILHLYISDVGKVQITLFFFFLGGT